MVAFLGAHRGLQDERRHVIKTLPSGIGRELWHAAARREFAAAERAAAIGCRHGVGIVDHIEDRIVGLKVRDIYEVPAAALILTAHEELERLVGTIHQNQFKPQMDQKWGYLVYAGLWWEPLREDLDAYMSAVNARVTGEIGLRLYKGSVRVVTRSSPNAVYDAQLASFNASGEELFSQTASPGFIELWSLQSKLAHQLRERDDD